MFFGIFLRICVQKLIFLALGKGDGHRTISRPIEILRACPGVGRFTRFIDRSFEAINGCSFAATFYFRESSQLVGLIFYIPFFRFSPMNVLCHNVSVDFYHKGGWVHLPQPGWGFIVKTLVLLCTGCTQ